MNDNWRVVGKQVPQTIYYVSNYVSDSEERRLLDEVYGAPKPKWKTLSGRRLQNWGGLPHHKGMIGELMPQWLQSYVTKVSQLKVFGENVANHVLVNEYLSGQGIMPHEDGPLFHPTVTTITLGSHTCLDFYPKPCLTGSNREVPAFSILLEPRSLVVVQSDAYNSYLHGIREISADIIDESVANVGLCSGVCVGQRLERDTRVSLTIRHVPKVINNKFFNNVFHR